MEENAFSSTSQPCRRLETLQAMLRRGVAKPEAFLLVCFPPRGSNHFDMNNELAHRNFRPTFQLVKKNRVHNEAPFVCYLFG